MQFQAGFFGDFVCKMPEWADYATFPAVAGGHLVACRSFIVPCRKACSRSRSS